MLEFFCLPKENLDFIKVTSLKLTKALFFIKVKSFGLLTQTSMPRINASLIIEIVESVLILSLLKGVHLKKNFMFYSIHFLNALEFQ